MLRECILFDRDWKFELADLDTLSTGAGWSNDGRCRDKAANIQYDDSNWQTVELPHDFVVERPFVPDQAFPKLGRAVSSKNGGYRPGGVGWYRKQFPIGKEDEGRRIYLRFDGIYRDSNVYVNEFFVGHHLSGYTSFTYDVTDFINYGGENLVTVRVDATRNEGWWYEGGGIYRHVWLEKVAPVHVATWGTFVSSELDLSGSQPRARLTINTRVANSTFEGCDCEIRTVILDPAGQEIAQVDDRLRLPVWGEGELVQHAEVDKAKLWSLETPQLYQLVTTLHHNGMAVDQYETPFGIRSIRFDAQQGFYLNEQPVKIKGVCCHQDHAGVGIAVPDGIHRFRLEKLKEMGCNAYRSAHHPATPELLDLCDRMGFLVMEENRVLSSAEESTTQLESMIRRDRNHPSVILWSLGNEEVSIQWKPQSRLVTRSMVALTRRLDPTRPVTLAICYWNPEIDGDEPLSNTPLPCSELDVMGFNYSPEHWEAYHETWPEQPLIVSEATSGLRTRGCYLSVPAKRHTTWEDVSEAVYPMNHWAPEIQWTKVAENQFLSGIFIWTGFDYRGEPTPHDWPAISSQFGVMDTCGFPKDNYFYYRAWWRPEPTLHLAPHWNWPERLNQPITVYCYSNCDEVEIFLNGNSFGRKKLDRYGRLEWSEITYQPGVLKAKGFRNGVEVASTQVETTSAAHRLRLAADREHLRADGRDVAIVTVAIVDKDDRVVPVADNEVAFSLEGDGKILGVGNGNPSSLEPDRGAIRRAFNGLCQVIVQSTDRSGRIVLTGSSAGLRSGACAVRVGGEMPGGRPLITGVSSPARDGGEGMMADHAGSLSRPVVGGTG